MSTVVSAASVPANSRVATANRPPGLEAEANNTRGERKAGKGRRRRAAAEQRRIEQQRWGQYLEDDDGDFRVVAPTPLNNRRRARRSSRRNSARDDLEEYLNGTVDDEFGSPLPLQDELELDVALALSLSLADPNSIAQNGRSQASTITDMTYESLVQLENVRCVASTAIVSALPVCCFTKEQTASPDQALEVCVICQGEFEDGELQVKLPCLHKFHQACGAEWLLNYSKLCPVCKHDVTEPPGPTSSV